jgi:hypothetical protein
VDEKANPALTQAIRWASAAVAFCVMVFVALYVLVPRTVTVVAPQCVGGGDCAVNVSASVDSAVVIAGLAFSALFAIMAITGLPFSVMLGNGVGLAPVHQPSAEQVPGTPPDAKPISPQDDELPADVAEQISQSAAKSLGLWNELPIDLQVSLFDFAATVFNVTNIEDVQLNIVDISRQDGPGNHAYYVTVKYPNREGTYTVKMSRGGQGKKRPTVSRHQED